MSRHSPSINGFKTWLCAHPVLSILVIGLIIRVPLSIALTHSYDAMYWTMIIENIIAGTGLYELPGYYYTPVWGYFISFVGMVGSTLFGINTLGDLAPELVASKGTAWEYYHELLSSVEYAFVFKMLFTIADVVISWLLYRIVFRYTGDVKKASFAFALWFFCPIVVYTSCVHAMFDSLAIMFIVFAVYFLLERRYLLAGVAFALASWGKLFPVYLIFILSSYVIKRSQLDGESYVRNLGSSIIGAFVASLIVILPNIIQGDVSSAFIFLTSRVEDIGGGGDDIWDSVSSSGYLIVLMLQPLIIGLQLLFAYKTVKGDDLDQNFLLYGMLSAVCIFLWTPTPTYLLIMLPFIILYSIIKDHRYLWTFALISISAVIYAMVMHNYSVFFPLEHFFGFVSPEFVLDGVGWMDSIGLFGVTNQNMINVISGAIETLSIYSVLILFIYSLRRDSSYAETS